IYVPSQMVTELGRKDLYHVLLHEMAHIKRGDLWVQAIGMALQVIYWFNPLVWFVRKRLHELRELCCDATVARRLGSAQHYRSSLLQAAKRLLPAGVPRTPMVGQLALFEDCAGIVTRIRALESRGWQYSSVRKFWNVMAAGAFVLLCLPMGAQSAQGECADILKWAEARLEYLQQQKDTKADGAAEVFNEQSS
ncbi:MAG: M56 family metallopeptidase, partial [Phycisphaerae bacterium]